MSVAEQVAISLHHDEETSEEEPLEDIALQFFALMHRKKSRKMNTKSPGLPQKSAANRIEADSSGGNDSSTATEDEGAVALGSAGGDPASPERARLIAQHLIEMGDDLENKLKLDALREALEKQFKLQSVFHMAYEGFSSTCVGFLASARDSITSGWDQLYVLAYGQYVVNEELMRTASPEGARTRMSTTARYFRDTVHEIGLDDWIQSQGGMRNVGSEVRGEESERMVPVNPPTESSVDK